MGSQFDSCVSTLSNLHMELKRQQEEVMWQLTQLTNEVTKGGTMPSNIVINPKAINAINLVENWAGNLFDEPDPRITCLGTKGCACAECKDINEFINSNAPNLKCLSSTNIACLICREFNELLNLQGAHDPLTLTDFFVPIGKLTLAGAKGDDGPDRGTLIEQAVVGTDNAGQPAMTSIPSPLGYSSLLTEHYVHDTGQGKSKRGEIPIF
ncbi:uncharacterized protein G2W53_033827 [Senna tora]|uniref:Uncharacterized protein n=1 Tax=Senna tora TaxID=362788 RepID=A0A834T214_9FABA|nr:uncharacterized protein G2W53_033827 [Senna tora]